MAAVIQLAGGSALVCGISSGAALALEAANSGLPIQQLALYELPAIVDDSRLPLDADYLARTTTMIAEGQRGPAVASFMKAVQVPSIFILLMKLMPSWRQLKATAHTLVHDLTLMDGLQRGQPLPLGRWSGVRMPTLVIDGGKSPAWMRNAQRALAGVLSNAKTQTLPGQTHMVNAKALTPALVTFFSER